MKMERRPRAVGEPGALTASAIVSSFAGSSMVPGAAGCLAGTDEALVPVVWVGALSL